MQGKSAEASTIQVVYSSALPRAELDELYEELSASFRDVSIRSREYGPQAAWEWALPASVIIYIIAKPILDGFLQEIGAEGSRRLKTTVGKIFTRVKQRNLRWASLSEVKRELAKIKEEKKRQVEEDKPRWIPTAGHPAPILSVEVELENTYSSAKFIFSHELDESSLLKALESLSIAVARATAEARSWQEGMKRDPTFRGMTITYVYRLDPSDWVQVFPSEEDKRDWKRDNDSLGI